MVKVASGKKPTAPKNKAEAVKTVQKKVNSKQKEIDNLKAKKNKARTGFGKKKV